MVKELKKIHTKAWNKFRYATDLQNHGKLEHWNYPEEDFLGRITGDCEDYALYCRKKCRKAGYKTRLVLCYTETGEFHCVLEISGYIMDNRHRELQTINSIVELGYKLVATSGYEPGDTWNLIQ